MRNIDHPYTGKSFVILFCYFIRDPTRIAGIGSIFTQVIFVGREVEAHEFVFEELCFVVDLVHGAVCFYLQNQRLIVFDFEDDIVKLVAVDCVGKGEHHE